MCITRSRWIPRNSGTLISHALQSVSKCSSVFSLLKSRADISFYDVQSFRALFVFTFNVLGFFECAFGRVFDSDIFPCPYWFFRQEAQYSFHTSYYYGDFSSALKILPLLEQVSKLCPEKAWQVMMSRSLEAGLGDSCGATTKLQNCLRMSATPFSLQFQHLTVTSHLFFICFFSDGDLSMHAKPSHAISDHICNLVADYCFYHMFVLYSSVQQLKTGRVRCLLIWGCIRSLLHAETGWKVEMVSAQVGWLWEYLEKPLPIILLRWRKPVHCYTSSRAFSLFVCFISASMILTWKLPFWEEFPFFHVVVPNQWIDREHTNLLICLLTPKEQVPFQAVYKKWHSWKFTALAPWTRDEHSSKQFMNIISLVRMFFGKHVHGRTAVQAWVQTAVAKCWKLHLIDLLMFNGKQQLLDRCLTLARSLTKDIWVFAPFNIISNLESLKTNYIQLYWNYYILKLLYNKRNR